MHKSHRPLDRLTLTLTLTLTFDLIFIGGRGIGWTISVPTLVILISAVLVLSCGQTDSITEADRRYILTRRRE